MALLQILKNTKYFTFSSKFLYLDEIGTMPMYVHMYCTYKVAVHNYAKFIWFLPVNVVYTSFES